MTLYINGSNLLISGGSLADNVNCCCDEICDCDVFYLRSPCDCAFVDYGPLSSLTDITITLTGTGSGATNGNNDCGNAFTCADMDGSYVFSCTNTDVCYWLLYYFCAAPGLDRYGYYRLKVRHSGSVSCELESGELSLTAGTPNPAATPTLLSCSAFLRTPRSVRTLGYTIGNVNHWLYDPSTCSPSCNTTIAEFQCQSGVKSWTSDTHVGDSPFQGWCSTSAVTIDLEFA